MHTIDELIALEAAATLPPWREVAESGEWWVEQYTDDEPEGVFVCDSSLDEGGAWRSQADIDFVIAARNALPRLLSLLSSFRAAHAALRAAQNAYAKQENQETLAALHAAEQAYAAALGRLVG